MRVHPLLPAIGLLTIGIMAAPWPSAAAPFEIKGTWAAEGKACQDAGLFVEFDGRDILAYRTRAEKARVAADYSTTYQDGNLTVQLTDVSSKAGDQWTFQVQDENAMRMENSLLASSGTELMRLTRCPSGPGRIAAH